MDTDLLRIIASVIESCFSSVRGGGCGVVGSGWWVRGGEWNGLYWLHRHNNCTLIQSWKLVLLVSPYFWGHALRKEIHFHVNIHSLKYLMDFAIVWTVLLSYIQTVLEWCYWSLHIHSVVCCPILVYRHTIGQPTFNVNTKHVYVGR